MSQVVDHKEFLNATLQWENAYNAKMGTQIVYLTTTAKTHAEHMIDARLLNINVYLVIRQMIKIANQQGLVSMLIARAQVQ